MEELSGKKYGSLTVLNEYVKQNRKNGYTIKWKCECDCGNVFYVNALSLKKRRVNYCPACKPVGVRNEKLYHVYHGILQRCYNPRNPSYSKYGGRGIEMCAQWRDSYYVFKQWAYEHGYQEGLTIDRIDSCDGYKPENCRWITLGENSARANYALHKNKSKLIDPVAISPDGELVEIDNIFRFATQNRLNYSTVAAALHGRASSIQHGWKLISNKSKP